MSSFKKFVKDNFRYSYGFLILILLATPIFVVKLNDEVYAALGGIPSVEVNEDLNEIRGKGLPYPRGNYSLAQLIAAYELNKEELYNALRLPSDYPESTIVFEAVQKKDIRSTKMVSSYMRPIIDEFEKKIGGITNNQELKNQPTNEQGSQEGTDKPRKWPPEKNTNP